MLWFNWLIPVNHAPVLFLRSHTVKERSESLLFLITSIIETDIRTIALRMGVEVNCK